MDYVEIGPPPPGKRRTPAASLRSIGTRSYGARSVSGMSAGALARQRSVSSGTRSLARPTTPAAAVVPGANGELNELDQLAFQPCAATASIFLYAQGRSVYCLHHDTLAVERRFDKHKTPVTLLSVDNVSERGAGRLVVTYDTEQTTIVWDLFTGEEITRFASYQPMRVAAWMKDGNVAFGNDRGEVVIFEPSTSEHQSARTIFDPITAIAPAADCQTYAIGFVKHQVQVSQRPPCSRVVLQVQERLHPHCLPLPLLHHPADPLDDPSTITYSRPGVACLFVEAEVGHAGGADRRRRPTRVERRQARRLRDTEDHPLAETKRRDRPRAQLDRLVEEWTDNTIHTRVRVPSTTRPSFMSPGMLTHERSETWAWDVRNKRVSYEQVPTTEGVTGLAIYGPHGVLFTVSANGKVQQYELSPPTLVRTVCPDMASGQSTPKMKSQIVGAAPATVMRNPQPAPRGPSSFSTIQRATSQEAMDSMSHLRRGMASPMSSVSRPESRSSARSSTRDRAPSISGVSGTTFSTFSPSMAARESTASGFWPASASAVSSRRSRGSRLRNEVLRSPEENIDLFPFSRQRLASLPYAPQPSGLDPATASSDDLRQQMLRVVFGWEGDIEDMIREELNHHRPTSMNATLLGRWLGESTFDAASAAGTESVTSTDWMMLALSNMGSNNPTGQHMGRNFAAKLQAKGDIHTAATMLVGLGDLDEAIDIYVTRNYYMEAILLTCLLYPEEWERQAHLVRRWGEFVVENSQQHLAIRCFSCTGTDTSLPWASPTASPFQGITPTPSAAQTLSPPTSPPPAQQQQQQQQQVTAAHRMTAKTSALKLITTFPPPKPKEDPSFQFPGLRTGDRTPTNAPGITPIAESALSPGATPMTVHRSIPSRSKTPMDHRARLPSIGETPVEDTMPPDALQVPNPLPTPEHSGSDMDRGLEVRRDSKPEKEPSKLTLKTKDLMAVEDPPLTLSAVRYDPSETFATPKREQEPQTAIPGSTPKASLSMPLRDPEPAGDANPRTSFEKTRSRNASRDRKPANLQIKMAPLSQMNLNAVATHGSAAASPALARTHRRSGSSSIGGSSLSGLSGRYDPGELTSPPYTGRSFGSAKSPSISGRSIDAHISSLDEASYYAAATKDRGRRDRTGASTPKHKSRSKGRHEGTYETASRGRQGERYVRPGKRSPSSPVPMSPEDLALYRATHNHSVSSTVSRDSSPEGVVRRDQSRPRGASKGRSVSKMSEMSARTMRHVSPGGRSASRHGSRYGSRRASPERMYERDERGRRHDRDDSAVRSPSSPVPMSPEDPAADALRIVEANRERLRSRQRSARRKPGGARARAPDGVRHPRAAARAPPPLEPQARRRPGAVARARRRGEPAPLLRGAAAADGRAVAEGVAARLGRRRLRHGQPARAPLPQQVAQGAEARQRRARARGPPRVAHRPHHGQRRQPWEHPGRPPRRARPHALGPHQQPEHEREQRQQPGGVAARRPNLAGVHGQQQHHERRALVGRRHLRRAQPGRHAAHGPARHAARYAPPALR